MTFDPLIMDVPTPSADYPAQQHLISLTSHDQPLLARVFVADGAEPHPTIIFCHGYPGTEQNFDLVHALCRAGWNVIHFHYRGAWGSDGDFTFSNALEDAHVVVDFVRQSDTAAKYRINPAKVVVMGHSMGGFAALMTAAKNPEVHAVASFAGFNFGIYQEHLRTNPDALNAASQDWDTAPVTLRGSTGQLRLDEIMSKGEEWDLQRYAPALAGKPLLLIAAQRDTGVPPAIHHTPLIAALQNAGAQYLQSLIIDDADHGFFQRRITLARIVIDWLNTL